MIQLLDRACPDRKAGLEARARSFPYGLSSRREYNGTFSIQSRRRAPREGVASQPPKARFAACASCCKSAVPGQFLVLITSFGCSKR